MEPELLCGDASFASCGRAVAALGARLLRRGGDASAFSSASMPDAGHAPALSLDARPLVQRGAIHGRVMGQLGGLDEPGPRLLLGDVAGVDRRPLRGILARVRSR